MTDDEKKVALERVAAAKLVADDAEAARNAEEKAAAANAKALADKATRAVKCPGCGAVGKPGHEFACYTEDDKDKEIAALKGQLNPKKAEKKPTTDPWGDW